MAQSSGLSDQRKDDFRRPRNCGLFLCVHGVTMLTINRLILLSGARTLRSSLRDEPLNTTIGILVGVLLLNGLLFGSQNLLAYAIDTLIFAILIYALHGWRKDPRILATLYPNWREIMLVQYQVLLLPFYAVLLLSPHPWVAAVLFVLSAPVACVRPRSAGKIALIERLVVLLPRQAFEWRSMLRSRWLLFLLIHLVAIGAITFDGILENNVLRIAPFAALTALAFGCAGSMLYSESRMMIEAFQMNASGFLQEKIFTGLKLLSLLMAPITIAYMVVFGDPSILLILVVSYLIMIVSILTKYAYHREGREPTLQLLVVSLVVFVLFPFLPLIIWLLWRKADRRLTTYLYAFS